MAQVKRETASICQVQDLLLGDFVKTEGWTPSYFSTRLGNLSRVNIIGVIVSKDQDGFLFDDGSGRILLRSFEQNSFEDIQIGDFVVLVGRPRAYNEQKYVMPEILKRISPAWADFRKVQVELLKKIIPVPEKETRVVINEPAPPIANYYQKIVDFIKDLDDGSGAEIGEVIKRSDVPKADELIRKLIEEGEIFELKPGKLKLLE
jgi:hypothetical protein